mmetsp:Transcript_19403/g.35145  ORF Transcript_19403/g.35145 Transcript_19403/m.35145 type:complete len:136 (+) Transcript_19403:89-496(+)
MQSWNSCRIVLLALITLPSTFAACPEATSEHAAVVTEKYCDNALSAACTEDASGAADIEYDEPEDSTYTLADIWSDFRLILSVGAGFFFMHMMEASRFNGGCGVQEGDIDSLNFNSAVSALHSGKKNFQIYPYAM